MEHLSSMDASFLHLETPETPMHVASLSLLELPKGYKDDFYETAKTMMSQRMHLAKVLTRKLAPMPFELSEPVWVEDDDIDIDYHVRSHTLRKPGSMEQLDSLVARLHSTLLDRSRPLWEMYIIEGLADGRVGLYFKAHHSGIDGKAGMEMAKVLYDDSPEIRQVAPPHRKRSNDSRNPYQLGVAELLEAAVANTARQYTRIAELVPTAARALAAAGRVLAAQQYQKKGERALSLGLAPKTIFNDSITNQRSYSALSVPFHELKAVGKRVGGTVNTIVMAMCSEALRRFLSRRNLLPKQALIAGVPVSLRSEANDEMNNQVSMVRVDLATDIADPVERFKAIHNSSEAAKAVVRELRPVLGVDMPVTGSPWLMTSLASLYGRSNLARRLQPSANVLISNVPGPAKAMYVAGARMVHYYPVSIPYHGNAVNITVHSYDGWLEFGITACRRNLSQAESYELIELLKDSLRDIERLPSAKGAANDADARPTATESAPPPVAPKQAGAKPNRASAPRKKVATAKSASPRKVAPAKKLAPVRPRARVAAVKTAARKAATPG